MTTGPAVREPGRASLLQLDDSDGKKNGGVRMFYVMDYYTGEIITCVDSFELAKKLCDIYDGAQVETEDDVVLYANIDLPF